MPFDQAFRLSALMLAAVSLSGLVLSGSVPPWLLAITGTILGIAMLDASGLLVTRPGLRRVAHASSDRLLIGAFALFLADLIVVSRDLLAAGIHFLVLLLGIKLLSLHERRDIRHLYAICLMAVLAAAALTTEVWYVPIFMLYLLTTVWTLLLYHLTGLRAPETTPDPLPTRAPDPGPHARLTGRFFWLTNGIAVVAFAMSLAIFFLVPRIGAGLLQKPRGETLKTTGFSDRVDLGTIGSVKQDPQIVMRVELPGSPAVTSLYLRGLAYDRYSGRSWSTSTTRRSDVPSFGDNTFVIRPRSRDHQPGQDAIQQDILLEPLDTAVLFTAPFPEYLTGDLPGVQSDGMAGLYLSSPASSRIRYSVVSRAPRLMPNDGMATHGSYPRSILDRYLQLPELSDKVLDLSRRIVREADSPYEQVTAVQNHLLRSYQYSLDLDSGSSQHPLEDFLFTRRSGYCEHYATAMVIMLRTVGIPARLVTGFLATEWNEFGGYFTVRQRDAHAWVEVYFPQSGWVTFDPTPAAGPAPARSWWNGLVHVGESARLYWDRFFVHYSARDQLAVIHGVRRGGDAVRDQFVQWLDAAHQLGSEILASMGRLLRTASDGIRILTVAIALLSLIVVLIFLHKAGRSRGSWSAPDRRRQLHITRLYRSMLHQLGRRGLMKRASATPTEFARVVLLQWAPAGTSVTILTDLYCRARFSGAPLSNDEISTAEQQLRTLHQLTRHTAHHSGLHVLRWLMRLRRHPRL